MVSQAASQVVRVNKVNLDSRSSSVDRARVARSSSSRVSRADPGRKADPANLDRANLDKANLDRPNKDCLASRSNYPSKGPVDRRRSSKANKAAPGQANPGPDQAPRVSQADQVSKSSSASRVLAASPSSVAQVAQANRACLDGKAFRNKVAQEACPVRLVSRSNSAAGQVPSLAR